MLLVIAARCELCAGATVTPPLGLHMQTKHPGCGLSTRQGYDHQGEYMRYAPVAAPCGQVIQRPEAGNSDTDEEG